ncbi:MAG: HNH endonuclease, partial [Chitinophagaceae bacterium]
MKLWSRDELIVALNLYLKLPFGKLHHRTKEIIELAEVIGRTPDAVAMRLNNFASVDPYHQRRGIVG